MAEYSKFIEQQIKAGATLIIEDPEEYFGHTQASNILLLNHALNDAEFRVYMVIRSFAYGQKIHCWPGQGLIGQLVGKSRETVNRIIQRLEKKNLIHSVQRGLQKTNVYIIKKIPMVLVERHQKLLEKTGVNKPSIPCKSTDVTKTSLQKEPSIPCKSTDVTKTSLQEVTKTSQKEYKKNNNVVVVKDNSQEVEEKSTNNQKPKSLKKEFEKKEKVLVPTEQQIQEIIAGIKEVTGTAIQQKDAVLVLEQFPFDYVKEKITEVMPGSNIDQNLTGWLLAACWGDWKKVKPEKPVKSQNNNNTRKSQPKSSDIPSPQDSKKLAMIRSLYMS